MKDLKLRDKVRTLLYMIGMVAVLFMAETTIAYATSDDDDLSNSILSEQPVDENRTNIREPGSSENADDLKQLNIANSLTVSYDGGNGELAGTLRILLILTAISLAPILLVTITSPQKKRQSRPIYRQQGLSLLPLPDLRSYPRTFSTDLASYRKNLNRHHHHMP